MVSLFFCGLILLAPQQIGQVPHALQVEGCSLPSTVYQAPPPQPECLSIYLFHLLVLALKIQRIRQFMLIGTLGCSFAQHRLAQPE
jgi:hypothetical protein